MNENQSSPLPAIQARRDAVLFLKTKKGYSWKAVAYALGLTPWRAECILHSEIRRRGDKFCIHQFTQGRLKQSGEYFVSLTCGKCGRGEYLSRDRKWTEFKAGTVTYSNL